MKKLLHICVVTCVSCLLMPAAGMAGKGYMGGSGKVSVSEEPVVVPPEDPPPVEPPDSGTITPDDKMADSGKLFGDLYVILRQQGIVGDTKLVPEVDDATKSPVIRKVEVIEVKKDTDNNVTGITLKIGEFTVKVEKDETTDYYNLTINKDVYDDGIVAEEEIVYEGILDYQGFLVFQDFIYFENNADKGIQLLTKDTNTGDTSDPAIGGEPVLTVIDPPENDDIPFIPTTNPSDYGWYAVLGDDGVTYKVAKSPYPAQCVQPIANYERWGDISSKTGLTKNRLPMVITYDATHNRSECAVGQVTAPPTVDSTGALDTVSVTNKWFIEPCTDDDEDGKIDITTKCQWEDPVNKLVTYPNGVSWADLIGEVSFGRLNIGRAPEAVLQAAFDEAINTINSPDTIAIKIDAAGRLLLQKNVYDELRVDPITGEPLLLGTTWKAIDSPLENVALYVKLMQDGHLITPADEREPIDRSKNGGIPIWKMLELEDGPADAALRPTIDINKMRNLVLTDLVVPVGSEETYYTYFEDVVSGGEVVDRILRAKKIDADDCIEGTTQIEETEYPCYTGLLDVAEEAQPDATDLNYTAAFLAAAADKIGHISQDMVVYINSILGINKVVGYSAYKEDGTPADGAIDYSKNPVYFNFGMVSGYSRTVPFGSRGDSGFVTVLQGGTVLDEGESPTWTESSVYILWDDNLGAKMPKSFVDTSWMPVADRIVFEPEPIFDNLKMYAGDNGAPILVNGKIIFDLATENILGFTQQSDDDLSVIRFIHTYQIPGLR